MKKGGKIISMKAGGAQEEIETAKKAIKILGGRIERIEEFKLPQTEIDRTIILIKKEERTPNKYPRKAGIRNKDPIK